MNSSTSSSSCSAPLIIHPLLGVTSQGVTLWRISEPPNFFHHRLDHQAFIPNLTHIRVVIHPSINACYLSSPYGLTVRNVLHGIFRFLCRRLSDREQEYIERQMGMAEAVARACSSRRGRPSRFDTCNRIDFLSSKRNSPRIFGGLGRTSDATTFQLYLR